MKVQLVTPYLVSLLQRYGVTVRGNVTSVHPPLYSNKLPLYLFTLSAAILNWGLLAYFGGSSLPTRTF